MIYSAMYGTRSSERVTYGAAMPNENLFEIFVGRVNPIVATASGECLDYVHNVQCSLLPLFANH